jgi:hypothetical protein
VLNESGHEASIDIGRLQVIPVASGDARASLHGWALEKARRSKGVGRCPQNPPSTSKQQRPTNHGIYIVVSEYGKYTLSTPTRHLDFLIPPPHGQKKPDPECTSSSCRNETTALKAHRRSFLFNLHLFYHVSISFTFPLSVLLLFLPPMYFGRISFFFRVRLFWLEGDYLPI